MAKTDERLSQINEELSKILEEKIEFLTRTLGETQRFTQKIAHTELEIQRNTSQHARFGEECGTLEKDLASLSARVQAVSSERDEKQNEKYAQEKGISEAGEKLKTLGKEKADLERETKKLQSDVDKLEAGVQELRELKKRLLGKSSALKAELGASGDEG